MTYQRDFDKKLKVALVGAGSHGYRNLLPVLHYLPVELCAICEVDETRAQATANEYGVKAYTSTKELYRAESLDAVLLSVSPQRHPDLACEAFEAGLHVWMEKPPAMSVADIDRMVRVKGGKVGMVGYKKAFMPSTQKAIELVHEPQFQPLTSILAEYPMSVPEDGEAVIRERRFTNWLANGCHPISLMVAVGGPVSEVVTHRSRYGDVTVILAFENGALGTLFGGQGTGPVVPVERYSFTGKNCSLVIENNWRVTLRRSAPFDYGKDTTYIPTGWDQGALVWEPQNCLATLENKALFTQGFYHELKAFCDWTLAGEESFVGSLAFARQVMQVYEAGLISYGNPVDILQID